MRPEDERRLQREAEIAAAVRGPDYTALEQSIGIAKAELAERTAAQNETHAKHRRGAAAIKRQIEIAGFKETMRIDNARASATRRIHRMREFDFER